jgi:hypothetical protein
MIRHVSKADEATSWRRAGGPPSSAAAAALSDRQAFAQQLAMAQAAHINRPASAPQHLAEQLAAPVVPLVFSAVEAQSLLDRRWAEVTEAGLQPTCICDGSSAPQPAAADGDAGAAAAAAGFLAELHKAVKATSADTAWEE